MTRLLLHTRLEMSRGSSREINSLQRTFSILSIQLGLSNSKGHKEVLAKQLHSRLKLKKIEFYARLKKRLLDRLSDWLSKSNSRRRLRSRRKRKRKKKLHSQKHRNKLIQKEKEHYSLKSQKNRTLMHSLLLLESPMDLGSCGDSSRHTLFRFCLISSSAKTKQSLKVRSVNLIQFKRSHHFHCSLASLIQSTQSSQIQCKKSLLSKNFDLPDSF